VKKIANSRFGEIEYDPAKILCLPEGLIGFEPLRKFVVIPNKKEGPLFWIQSIEDPQVAFVLTDPTNFFLEYRVAPDKNDRDRLGISENDDCFALAIVTVPPDQHVTLNLAAPILFAPRTNRAIQVVLDKGPYSSRQPLPSQEPAGKQAL